MAEVLRTTLDVIYLDLQARLVSFLNLQAHQCLIMDPDALPAHMHPSKPPFYLLLWPAPESANQPIFRGAARYDTRLTERMEVVVRTCTALDDYKEREIWLTGGDVGHLLLRNQIWDALVEYTPMDEDENVYTIGPLTPAQSRRPKLTDQKKYYGESALGFEFIYMPYLSSLTIQAE